MTTLASVHKKGSQASVVVYECVDGEDEDVIAHIKVSKSGNVTPYYGLTYNDHGWPVREVIIK